MTNCDFCISSYLAFRYVAKPGIGWKNNVVPEFPNLEALSKYNVNNAQETLEILRRIISESIHGEKLGILLSGGIDSAIIAALLPRGTRAYTIRFISQGAIDESPMAGSFAEILGLEHTVVDVTWDDYDDCMDLLMRRKKAPLHPVEVGVYKASCTAHNDGIYRLLTGNVADSTFGGFDKLLSKDWTFDEFVARYIFLDPSQVVKRPVLWWIYLSPTGSVIQLMSWDFSKLFMDWGSSRCLKMPYTQVVVH